MGNKQSGEAGPSDSAANTNAPTPTPSKGQSVQGIKKKNSNRSSAETNVVQEVDKAEQEARLRREQEEKDRAQKRAVEAAKAKVEAERKRIEKENAERSEREKEEAAKALASQREEAAKRDAEKRAAEDRAALERAKELETQREKEEEERKRKERQKAKEAEEARKRAEQEKVSKASVLDDLLAMANDHSEPKGYQPVVAANAPSGWNPDASGFDNSRFRKANRSVAPASTARAAPTPETRRVEDHKRRSQAVMEIGDDDESLMDDILNGL